MQWIQGMKKLNNKTDHWSLNVCGVEKNQPRRWKIGDETEQQARDSGNLKINQKEIFLEGDSNQLLNSVDRQGKDQELRPLVTLKRKFSEAWWRWNPEWNGFKIEKGETSRRTQTTLVKSFSLRESKVKTIREGSRDMCIMTRQIQ